MALPVYATRSDLDDFGGLPDGALSNEGRIAHAVSDTADTFELDAHGLVTDEDVQIRSVEGGTLPAPLVDGATYYAIRVSDAHFKLSATAGGAAIDLTTPGTGEVVVIKPLPIDRFLELYSRWVDDILPAHMVPLEQDEDGNYPIQVVRAVSLLAGKQLLNKGGESSAIVSQNEIEQKAVLERWATGVPLRNIPGTYAANLAVTATLSSATDTRGWGSDRLP